MIILTAGHTGAGTGAQCATTQFDEGAETIWLRDRIAEILTNKYGLVVLVDNDTASLQLLTKQLSATPSGFDGGGDTPTGGLHPRLCSVTPSAFDFLIDIHFNAHTNPNARGTETIVADDATELELRMASRLAHATADSLEIPLRCIKSESQTPHKRLAMLHLTPQSVILEVCFITSPEDVKQYRRHRRKIASTIAKNIANLVK